MNRPKVTVRRLEYADLPERNKWFGDELVLSQMPVPYPPSLADTESWFASNRANPKRLDFVLEEEDSKVGRLLAMGGLVGIDRVSQHTELYLMVNPASRGLGIGSRTLHWLCNYAFTELYLRKVFLYTVEANGRAREFYERAGFIKEGILREHLLHRGRFVNRYVHGLLRSEWERVPWRSDLPAVSEVAG